MELANAESQHADMDQDKDDDDADYYRQEVGVEPEKGIIIIMYIASQCKKCFLKLRDIDNIVL